MLGDRKGALFGECKGARLGAVQMKRGYECEAPGVNREWGSHVGALAGERDWGHQDAAMVGRSEDGKQVFLRYDVM